MTGSSGGGSPIAAYSRALLVVLGATAIGLVARGEVRTIDLAMVYLLAVVMVAARSRRGPALLAAILGVVLFDFLFVPPYYTLNVRDTQYFFTFLVMFVVALTMGGLTTRIHAQADSAREEAARIAALYDLDRALAPAGRVSDVLELAADHLGRAVHGRAMLLTGESGAPVEISAGGIFGDPSVRAAAMLVVGDGRSAGAGTDRAADADALVTALRRGERTLGIAVVWRESDPTGLGTAERRTVEAMSDLVATAIERTTLAEQHEQARRESEAEKLRTALLSSLSHDLRTPLGSIEGAVSTLAQDQGDLTAALRHELAETIQEESRRMARLIGNLLDMIRVESGSLAVHRSWQPLEESLGTALLRLDERLGGHRVETELPGDLPLVSIDEVLLEQVFINLLENAARHTPPGTAVTVRAWAEADEVLVEVADSGPGIRAAEREKVFEKFYRAGGTSLAASGSGLGLSICRGIITAHGGKIWIEEAEGGGTSVRFTLPLIGPRPGAVHAAGAAAQEASP
jgi:two-component system, OmpR family, sensor histidine kinase KdpD